MMNSEKTKNGIKATDDISSEDEALFRRLMDNLPGMVYRCHIDHGWSMIFVSQGVEALCGYTPDELIDNSVLSWTDIISPDDRDFVYQQVMMAVEAKQTFHLSYRIITKDGTTRHVWERGKAVYDSKGAAKTLEGFIMDVTDAFMTRQQLELSEKRFKLFAENANDIIYRMSLPDCHYEYISKAVEIITGYSPSSFYNDPNVFISCMHPDCREYMREQVDRLLNDDDIPLAYEYKIVNRFGETRWLHQRNTIIRDANNRPIAIEGIVTDLSDQKKAELALKEKRQQLLQAQRLGHLASWELDLDTLIFHASEYALKLTGIVPSSTKHPLSLDDLIRSIHPDDQPRIAAKIKNALMIQKGFEDEWRIKQDKERRLHVIVEFDRNEFTGKPRCWGTIQDITLQHVTEMRQAHTEKMSAVARFAGGIAHDLNNLTHVIIGFADMMRDEVTDNSSLLSDVSEIQKAAYKAQAFIENLQAFSRNEEFTPTLLNMGDIVSLVAYETQQTRPKSIHLIESSEPDLHMISGNEKLLRQMVKCILGCATEAIPDGGTIKLHTANIVLDESVCRTDPDLLPGDYILLTIKHDGPGIDQDSIDHVFEPFCQINNKRSAGLTLTIAYANIKRHNGHITVSNLPQKGVVFSVYLPASRITGKPEFSNRPKPEEESPVHGGTETILLAEDDELVCRISQGVLTRMGYHVLIAHDGREALRLFNKHKGSIDLLILDIVMPYINGNEVYQVINKEHPDIPVLFSSGYDKEVLRSDFLLQVPGMMIHKPYSNKELLHAVRHVISSRH